MGSSVSKGCKAVGGEAMTGKSLKVYAILLYSTDQVDHTTAGLETATRDK